MYLPKNYATALTNVLCSPFYQMAESYYLLISEGYNEKINVMPFINSHKGNIFTEEALKKWEFLRNGLQGDLKRLDFWYLYLRISITVNSLQERTGMSIMDISQNYQGLLANKEESPWSSEVIYKEDLERMFYDIKRCFCTTKVGSKIYY